MTIVGTAEIELKPHTSNFAKDAAKAIAVAGVGLTAAAGAFIAKSEHTFSEVGSQVKQLTRLTGVSAESASVLRVQANAVGVDVDTLGRSIVLLSKNIELHGDKIKKLGVDYQDARGHVLPMDQILGNVAEKFANMPDGIAKNTLAVQLFGKSGTQLLPFLNKGKAGLAELSDEAHKFGLVLSQDNLDALKKNAIAHRQFHDALEGLQLTMGSVVLPIMTKFIVALDGYLFPIIQRIAAFIRVDFGPGISKAFDLMAQAWNAFLVGFENPDAKVSGWTAIFVKLGQIASGAIQLISDALSALYGYIERDVYPHIADAWHAVGQVFSDVADVVSRNAGPVFTATMDGIKTAVDAVSGFIHDTAWPRIQEVYGWLKEKLDPVAKFVKEKFDDIKKKIETELIPALRDKLAPVVRDDVPKAFKGMVDYIQDHVLPILGALGTAAGVTLVAQFANLAGAVSGAIQGLGPILGAIASPAGLAAIGLAALAGGLIYAYQHSEKFRDTVDKAFAWLKENVPPALERLTSIVKEKIQDLKRFWDDIWPRLKDAILNVLTVIKIIIEAALGAIYIGWKLWGDDIYQFLNGALNFWVGLFKLFVDLISGHWSKLWGDLVQVVTGFLEQVTAIIGAVWNAITAGISFGFDLALKAWSGLWNEIVGVVTHIIKDITDAVGGIWGAIKKALANGFELASKAWSDLWNAFWDTANRIVNDVIGVVKALIGWITKAADKLTDLLSKAGLYDKRKQTGNYPGDTQPSLGGGGTYAAGGIASGWAFTGEKGIELANYGSPSRIVPHDQIGSLLAQAGGSSSGGSTINIEINAPGATAQTVEALRVLARDEIANTINSVVRKATTGAGSK